LTGEQANSAVDVVFDAIELGAGRDIAIAGFGKFSVAECAARDGRNPATGETIHIPPAVGRSSPRPRASSSS
jgi:DNA-binding protein HU-beta